MEEEKKIIAYKGMNQDMTCRGFQYEVGKEYEKKKAELCKSGFHACEYPLNVFEFYPPNTSRYFQVEQSDGIKRDDKKTVSKKIKIGAELGIPGLVKAAIEYTAERSHPEDGSSATGDLGAASATGKSCVALAAGRYGKAKGSIGSAICVVERGEWDGETYPIITVKAAIVDGKEIKTDTWYTVKSGKFVEVAE